MFCVNLYKATSIPESMDAAERFKLKHFIKDLENFRGRHTELVTVYVPSGYDMNAIINHLQQEQGTASNIKSKSTRENVIAALESERTDRWRDCGRQWEGPDRSRPGAVCNASRQSADPSVEDVQKLLERRRD